MPTIFPAQTTDDFEIAKQLLIEYADSLGFDLCFQDFDKELANLSIDYAPPQGCFLLAEDNNQPAGCVALNHFDKGICEMKRLYVKKPFRRKGIGRALAQTIIDQARLLDYHCMRLDMVLPRDPAQTLYISLGFKQIPPYRHNPLAGAYFMELTLQ